jgi:spermidine synthase
MEADETNEITVWEMSDPKDPEPYRGHLVAQGRSDKQEWVIIQHRMFREMLFIDGQHQSSRSDEHKYHETLIHGLMACLESPKKVLILGGAEGCGIREVLKWHSVERIVQVDWDDELVRYFQTEGSSWNGGVYEDTRVEYICQDAFAWLRECTEQFDAIFVDLLDPTPEDMSFMMMLLNLCKPRIAPRGGLSVNVGQVERGHNTNSCGMAYYMKRLFSEKNRSRLAIRTMIPSYGGEWCFLMTLPSTWNIHFRENKLPNGLRHFTEGFFEKNTEWTLEYPQEIAGFRYR